MGIMYSGSLMELGNTEDIFSNPLHPYTQMLIGALPKVGDKSTREGIPGGPPSLRNPLARLPLCAALQEGVPGVQPVGTEIRRGGARTLRGLPSAGKVREDTWRTTCLKSRT